MVYEIDRRSPVPSYQQLADLLRADIKADRMGEQLPSLRYLVQETGLDVKTVQHAIQVLAGEGLVDVVPGRGTFVRPPA